ncbi:hypothetical protein MTZ49_11110 [Entomomonas sp. E2T0]|uniref:hypothetical protein n=1 Tax=Entomomonas sp. E2T0 TaxID=2930213 RepID=UPI00222810B3|nr:hypothetical protein [Entomomonas sp. E2T0]UYZ83147.1 hypothetical protein MTZ49_11110 [Entomomonas sp. E2T0]
MKYVTVTLHNALELLNSSKDLVDINDIVEEVADLTHSTIKDNTSFEYNANYLEKIKGNEFMIKVLRLAEYRMAQVKALWTEFKRT